MFRVLPVFILMLLIAGPGTAAFAADREGGTRQPSTSFGINALDAVGGMVTFNGEHLFGGKHGLFLEGGTGINDNYTWAVAYHKHNQKSPNKPGLLAPFWGPFIRYGSLTNEVKDDDSGVKYKYQVEYLTVGLELGRSYRLSDHFHFGWRLGYGYPAMLSFEWTPDNWDEADVVETVTSVLIGLEGGLSFSVVF